jgi:excisionase family DNA binding protein
MREGRDHMATTTSQTSTEGEQSDGLKRSDLMTAREVAELLYVPVSTVHEWGREAVLPRIKLGRHVRFLRSEAQAAILAARDPHRRRR